MNQTDFLVFPLVASQLVFVGLKLLVVFVLHPLGDVTVDLRVVLMVQDGQGLLAAQGVQVVLAEEEEVSIAVWELAYQVSEEGDDYPVVH